MAPAVPGVDLSNLLLGLAWLGELDRLQIQRLWFVGKSVSTVEKTLARLHKEGLIARRSGSVLMPLVPSLVTHHSGSMPAVRATLIHFAISDLLKAS